jgi:hypothetical protein
MNLVSFEKLAESDLVSDFISGLGDNSSNFSCKILQIKIFSGLSTSGILSSLTKSLGGPFKWGDNSVADILNWDKGQPNTEKCAVLSKSKMKSANCDTPNNFMCEVNSKQR